MAIERLSDKELKDVYKKIDDIDNLRVKCFAQVMDYFSMKQEILQELGKRTLKK